MAKSPFRINRKSQNSFLLKDILVLVGGTSIAQLVAIALTPLLSRVYSPAAFGAFGTVMAFVGILSLVAALCFETALVLENDDDKAGHLLNLIYLSLGGTTLFAAAPVLGLSWYFSWIPELSNVAYLLTLPLILIFAIYNVFIAVHNRSQLYKEMASAQILRKAGIGVFQLAFSILLLNELGLIVGAGFGVLVPIFYLSYRNRILLHIKPSTFHNLMELAVQYRNFPLYSVPQNLLNLISGHAPTFAFAYYYNLTTAGAFFFALKIVQIPASFIGLSVRQIFLKECAKVDGNRSELFRLFFMFSFGLTLFMVIPVAVVFAFGAELFAFAFGEEWRLAGMMSSFMIAWIASNIVAAPSRSLFLSQDKQDVVLVFDMVSFGVKLVILLLLPSQYSALQVVGAVSCLMLTVNTICIFYWAIKLRPLATRI